jgi:predicted phage replisome organizer
MAEYRKEKFYWLKLKRDFFKRHDIKVVESMDNGKEYILFYMKLLLESVDHNGNLRFNETIPYNEKMLATITDTNIDIVRNAMKIFTELKLIDIMDDSTIYMNEVNNMIGIQTYGAEKKQLQLQKKNNVLEIRGGTKVENLPPDIDKEIELEKEIEIKKEVSNGNSDLHFMEQLNQDTKKNTTFETLEKLIKHNFLTPKRDLTEVEARMLFEWVGKYPKPYLEHIISELCLVSTDKRNFRYLKGAIEKAYDSWSDKPVETPQVKDEPKDVELDDVFAELKALKEKGKK